jgi:2-isopropylmalate synthase
VLSAHCHNDLGMAVANSLAAVQAGARQVECTINGIGERAGNASLEEIVMALEVRADALPHCTGIHTPALVPTSNTLSSIVGIAVPPNKAIVGANAFAHEAGIHQDGMLKNASTYEIMRPESVGAVVTKLVLGKHSGRAAVKSRLAELGYALVDNDLDKAFARFKSLADRKKTVTDADLVALVADELYQPVERYALAGLDVKCGTGGPSSATVRVKGPEDSELVMTATGTGPVDAVFRAIDSLLQVSCTLLEYSVQAVTEGIDALGEVSVKVESARLAPENPQHATSGTRVYHGHGAETDIVVASAKAKLTALNRIVAATDAAQASLVREAQSEGVAEPAS